MQVEPAAFSLEHPLAAPFDENYICVRGRRLPLDELVDPKARASTFVAGQAETMRTADPFPHLVFDNLFNPLLLELVLEEFDMHGPAQWHNYSNHLENTLRSSGHEFGPASQLYFNLVNSALFIDFLSGVSGVPGLIADAKLKNGGLHETRRGGNFAIHRDFDRHPITGLNNEMVMLTYLNKEWDPKWGGALELWTPKGTKAVRSIQPQFGRTLLMRHGPASFHGHPNPLASPEDKVRRSVASYYYSNPSAAELIKNSRNTYFLAWDRRTGGVRRVIRKVTPPIVLKALRMLIRGRA